MTSSFIKVGPYVALKCGRKIPSAVINLSQITAIEIDAKEKYQIEWGASETSGFSFFGSGGTYSNARRAEVCPEENPMAHQAISEWLERLG